ncbi:hypothetical protein SEA_RASOVI_57 [Microbacterium phage Rasovi]|nr:hypothetical protein SEA_RASOVI_57 [Microbacterium phage Rasovi]
MGTEIGQSTLDAWTDRIAQALGVTVDGGPRVALREVLQEAFQRGLHYNDWSPVEDQEQAVKTRGSALYQWWMQTAHDEITPMLGKMVEYGGANRATDLIDIGRVLEEAGVRVDHFRTDQHTQTARQQELGCFFYLQGKFGRWVAAVKEGRPVSDDTLHDIGIYVRMVQRIRAVGGWPV